MGYRPSSGTKWIAGSVKTNNSEEEEVDDDVEEEEEEEVVDDVDGDLVGSFLVSL